jgi:HlyD family secretion protein
MHLNKKAIVIISLVTAAAMTALLIRYFISAQKEPSFRFTTVERGDIQTLVSATGTLSATKTVSVGTQVSGQVSELFADFNDHVKKGQLLARIDPTIAQQGVADAQANLEKAQAQKNQASADQNRNRELSSDGLIAPNALEQGGSALKIAQADMKSAGITLQRAKQNLSFTSIYAPIDGVVIERNVNNGQTVAASLSAPQLFLIANDLSHMQILAQVGESDIDQIKEAQLVKFTVQALPGRTFTGIVQQVRLQSTTADNVVNYTVVVTLENPDGKLLPGMTARVDFLVKSANNVLKVSNAALRYKPSTEVIAQYGAAAPSKDALPAAGSNAPTGTQGGAGGMRARKTQRSNNGFGTLYYLDPQGKLLVTRVHTGISNGASTEIQNPKVTEGMKVIDGIVSTTASNEQKSSKTTPNNPLGGSQQNSGGRGRGF